MPARTLYTDEQFSSPLFTLAPTDDPISGLLNASNLIKNLATVQVIDPETYGGLLYAIGDMINTQAHELDDMQEKARHQQQKARHQQQKAQKAASITDVDVSCELAVVRQKLAYLYGSLIKHPASLEPGEAEGLGSVLADLQQEVSGIERKLYPV